MKKHTYCQTFLFLISISLTTCAIHAQEVQSSRVDGNLMFDVRVSDLSSVSELSGFKVSNFVGIGSQTGQQEALDGVTRLTAVVHVTEKLEDLKFHLLIKFKNTEGRLLFCEHVLGNQEIATKEMWHELPAKEQPIVVGARTSGSDLLRIGTKRFLSREIAQLPSRECLNAWRKLPNHSVRLALDSEALEILGSLFNGLHMNGPVFEEFSSVLGETRRCSFSASLADKTLFFANLKSKKEVSESDYLSRINILLFAARGFINESFEVVDFESGQISLAIAEFNQSLKAKIENERISVRIPRPSNAATAIKEMWILLRNSFDSSQNELPIGE